MTDKLLQELENKLKEMEIESIEFQEKIRTCLHNKKQVQVSNPISYFNYSTIIDQENNQEHTVIGTFHFHNQTALPLHSPVILLKINSDKPYDFSGKYVLPNKPLQNETFFWERIENSKSNRDKEYLFKPVSNEIIPPNETFSFSNFQLRFTNVEPAYIQVEGFIYYKERMEGIASLNSISINY
ncbi:hypothetical protein [Peribacillus loiseleuriae]|uniref:Uncharacterized protein n=1 Tax=Peribacillus loiseleuriae TaxID=1679170 RepID=A0A0K9GX68_9BACI|nr:hypothetical protein [Peribacillus loiseleuriae]KMY51289.1 hypothetical protein AC625_18495 [Peribacillus loiseleuriae]